MTHTNAAGVEGNEDELSEWAGESMLAFEGVNGIFFQLGRGDARFAGVTLEAIAVNLAVCRPQCLCMSVYTVRILVSWCLPACVHLQLCVQASCRSP